MVATGVCKRTQLTKGRTMTQKAKTNDAKKVTLDETEMKSVLMEQKDFLVPVVQEAVQAILEVEMEECLQAGKHERSEQRLGYRSGYYRRRLITRVGTMVLRVPQDRAGHFSTQVFEQYQRSEKALVAALAQMYVQGVSTRKVAAITEELCGHEFSASSISAITARLDAQLEEFSRRPLSEAFPYVVVDARYERVREGGVIVSRAILIALGIDWEGRRQVLAVEYANRESQSSWRELLLQLKARGLHGVQFVVSDDHPGLKAAIREVLPEVWWQRCYVHFLRNALDYLPRKADDDCLQELRWMYERRNVEEARRDLKSWLEKWSGKYPKLCAWVESNIEETWTFYRLPLAHHKHLKSTNLLERFNQEIKRRTLVVRIFPDEGSCLRLVRAVAAEQHEEWMEGSRYLNADLLREQLKPMKTTMAIAA
jgi:putative transposase